MMDRKLDRTISNSPKKDKLINTPNEAIEVIKSNMPTSGYEMLRESLEMAIEALKGECDTI